MLRGHLSYVTAPLLCFLCFINCSFFSFFIPFLTFLVSLLLSFLSFSLFSPSTLDAVRTASWYFRQPSVYWCVAFCVQLLPPTTVSRATMLHCMFFHLFVFDASSPRIHHVHISSGLRAHKIASVMLTPVLKVFLTARLKIPFVWDITMCQWIIGPQRPRYVAVRPSDPRKRGHYVLSKRRGPFTHRRGTISQMNGTVNIGVFRSALNDHD